MEVPHAHVHLIPLNKESDASFTQPKLKLSEDEFEEIAEKIRNAF
jgi:histidine triad (HIT) family protein